MKSMLFVLATVLVCIGPMRAPAAANLVQNGNFSNGDLTGWTPINVDILGNYGGHVTQVLNGPEPLIEVAFLPDIGFGAFILTDHGWGAILQTLHTVPGQSYDVHYLVSVIDGPCLGDSCGTTGGFVTIFDGIGHMGADPKEEKGFAPPDFPPLPPGSAISTGAFYFFGTYDETFSATATDTLTLIEFASTCPGCNFFITDVSVNPILTPGPPTSFLLVAGLLGIWISVRRGRTKHR